MNRGGIVLAGSWAIILLVLLIAPLKANSAFVYKSYTIRYDRGWDILCDPYVVQKNDWVLKLFRQKGEIAHKDFPDFLRIFKRINPHVRDVDRIRPGQHIMIPLRKLRQGALPGQSSGIVTIPFVTISNVPEKLKMHSGEYEVQQGDCVSILIAKRFGGYGSTSYQDGIKLFKLMNPDIENLDRIYAGQRLRIPDPAIRSQPWYPSLFDYAGDGYDGRRDTGIYAGTTAPESLQPAGGEDKPETPLSAAASVLNAKLFDKGKYYLPRPGQDDFELDLSRMPLLELKDGTRILVPEDYQALESKINTAKSCWNNVKVVQLSPGASAEQIFNSIFELLGIDFLTDRLSFSDNGIEVETSAKWVINELSGQEKTARKICISLINGLEQRTPESIARYLEQHGIVIKDVLSGAAGASPQGNRPLYNTAGNAVTVDPADHRALVNELLAAMGYQYAPNVSITFPHANIQVKAVSNLVTKRNGSPLLIDFGDFFGNAIAAIEKTGFDIIQVTGQDSFKAIFQKLLDALGLSYSNDPTFWAANRSAVHNTALTIPGYLVAEAPAAKVLFSKAPLHSEVIQLLKHQGVTVVMLGMPEQYS